MLICRLLCPLCSHHQHCCWWSFRGRFLEKGNIFGCTTLQTPSARLCLYKRAPSGSGNIFKLLAPISHVLARRSSLSSCPPPVLLILATQLLFCRHVQCFQTFFSSRPDICCDFYLYLTITIPQTHHVLLRLLLVSWKVVGCAAACGPPIASSLPTPGERARVTKSWHSCFLFVAMLKSGKAFRICFSYNKFPFIWMLLKQRRRSGKVLSGAAVINHKSAG